MIEGLTVLGLIPARGGSKGIPGKNLVPLFGKPLVAWTIEAAATSRTMDRTILSTEDEGIASAARSLGCEVPFLRPKELAADDTPGIEPVLHALSMIRGFDIVVLLQPTSPLRTALDIDAAVTALVSNGAPAVVSVTEAASHPAWTYQVDEQGRLVPFLPAASRPTRRQELPTAWALNGAIYVARTAWIMDSRSFLCPETIAFPMPAERGLDIDEPLDLLIAEAVFRHQAGPGWMAGGESSGPSALPR